MKVTVIPIVIGAFSTVTKGLLKGLGDWRTRGENLNYSIVKIAKKTVINPGDLNRFGVTQNLKKDHQLRLMLKKP